MLGSVLAVAAFALLAAGCGGGGSPGVASVASTATTVQNPQAGIVAFSRCMRSHGVPSFPDPKMPGGLNLKLALLRVGADRPRVRTAMSACNHLLPVRRSEKGPVSGSADCRPTHTCYTPRQLEVAYGIEPLLQRGIDGRGQTVVMPEAAQQPAPDASDIRQDMTRFDRLFGLPPARLRVVNGLARSTSPWLASGEEVEDTEMVHAVAPGAAISVVLVPQSALRSAADFAAALTAFLRLGATHGGVLSLSATIGEHYLASAEAARMHAALRADRDHQVTVVAASGDKGATSDLHFGSTRPTKEVSLPASDPLVLAAGGTRLTADRATGAYIGETAWNTLPAPPSSGDGSSASGGGFSHLFTRPGYQDGVPGAEAMRGVPDVAGDAAFDTGMAVASAGGSSATVRPATGTSAAAPFWAGLVALADQYAGRRLGFVDPALYRIARSARHPRAFHDTTRGNNTASLPPVTITGYRTAPGWDPVTGWGSPDAQVLVPLLASDAGR